MYECMRTATLYGVLGPSDSKSGWCNGTVGNMTVENMTVGFFELVPAASLDPSVDPSVELSVGSNPSTVESCRR